MRTFGGTLGRYLPAMPDGEVGERRSWVNRLSYQIFNGHLDLDTHQAAEAGRRRRATAAALARRRLAVPGASPASSACASAIRARGSATRGTRSRPISCSAPCARRESCRGAALSDLDPDGQQRHPAALFPRSGRSCRASARASRPRSPPRSRSSSTRFRTRTSPSSGTAPGKCRRSAAPARTCRREPRSRPTCAPIGRLSKASRRTWRSASISASARSAAGRRFAPDDLGRPVELVNAAVASDRPARRLGAHPDARPRPTTRSTRRSRGSMPKGARVYLGAIHTMATLDAAPRRGAQIPAGLRPRRLLRLRPHAAGARCRASCRITSTR